MTSFPTDSSTLVMLGHIQHSSQYNRQNASAKQGGRKRRTSKKKNRRDKREGGQAGGKRIESSAVGEMMNVCGCVRTCERVS